MYIIIHILGDWDTRVNIQYTYMYIVNPPCICMHNYARLSTNYTHHHQPNHTPNNFTLHLCLEPRIFNINSFVLLCVMHVVY